MAPSTPAPAALHPYQQDGHWWFDCLTCELTCGPFTTRDQADDDARGHALQQHQRQPVDPAVCTGVHLDGKECPCPPKCGCCKASPKPIAKRDGLWRAIERAVYEFRERTMLWGETDGVTEAIADHARRAVQQYLFGESYGNQRLETAPPCRCGHPKDRHRDDPHLCLDCWRTGTTGTFAQLFGDTSAHEHLYVPQEQS